MRRSREVFPILLALVFCTTMATPQSLSWGGRVGINGAFALFEDGPTRDQVKIRPGIQLGGLAAVEFGTALSIQVELSYAQKGWAEAQNGGSRRLTYLDVPLLVALRLPWNTYPHMLVGPSVSLELGCAITGVPDVGSVGCDNTRVAWDRKKTQLGLWWGVGVGRQFGTRTLELQLLGNLHLTDMNREVLPRGYARLFAMTLSVAYKTTIGGW